MREKKYSGIKWMGNIPSNWSVIPLKQMGFLYGGLSGKAGDDFKVEGNDKFYPFIPFTNIFNHNEISLDKLAKVKVAEGEVQNFVQKGDILFLMSSEDFESLGKPSLMNHSIDNLCLNSFCKGFHITIDNVESRYLNYYLQSALVREYVRSQGNGFIRINLKASRLACTPILQPAYSEQQRIADFLDRKCADIDDVLNKTRNSIEEYKRLKQSIITEAVTKGVRGERPMKDSGSTWFGQIPNTWDANKLKYTFTIRKRIVGEDGHTVLAITQKGVKPKDMSNGNGQFAESYANYQIVHPGDFAMNHMDLLTGWVDISKYEGVTSPDYRVFTLDDTTRNCPSHYLYMMQMCYSNRIFYSMGQGVSGMGRWRLPADMFNNFIIACPPYEEQQEIAEYLDKKCSEIDSLIASKEKFITELESYKKSLIYEYVTGKKEVTD